jgi:hypothetical protein
MLRKNLQKRIYSLKAAIIEKRKKGTFSRKNSKFWFAAA